MSSGTKVYKYRCGTCQREVELVSDNRRPDPLRCVITDQCRGSLQPLGSRRGDRAKLTIPSASLADRVPRGALLQVTAAAPDPVFVGMSSFASMNGLSLAGPRRTVDGSESVYSVLDIDGNEFELERRIASALYPTGCSIDVLIYELTAAVLTSQKYTFVFSGLAQQVEGIDNSKEQRLLRFSSSDNLTLLANGVELDPSQYDRTEADTVRLTPGIAGAEVIIDVYVFKDRAQLIDESTLIRLSFVPLSETDDDELIIRSGSSWGDIARLETPDAIERSVLYCINMLPLEERKTYGIARFEAVNEAGGSVVMDPAEGFLLLSDAPHSFIDKRLDEVITGTTLVGQQFNFTYDLSEATGALAPVASEGALTLLQTRLVPVSEVDITPSSTAGTERAYAKRAEAYIIGVA